MNRTPPLFLVHITQKGRGRLLCHQPGFENVLVKASAHIGITPCNNPTGVTAFVTEREIRRLLAAGFRIQGAEEYETQVALGV